LKIQVRLMRSLQLLGRDADHARVDVHERCQIRTRFP
jgi:hypothetical protein